VLRRSRAEYETTIGPPQQLQRSVHSLTFVSTRGAEKRRANLVAGQSALPDIEVIQKRFRTYRNTLQIRGIINSAAMYTTCKGHVLEEAGGEAVAHDGVAEVHADVQLAVEVHRHRVLC
jgi:hypothetical protein